MTFPFEWRFFPALTPDQRDQLESIAHIDAIAVVNEVDEPRPTYASVRVGGQTEDEAQAAFVESLTAAGLPTGQRVRFAD